MQVIPSNRMKKSYLMDRIHEMVNDFDCVPVRVEIGELMECSYVNFTYRRYLNGVNQMKSIKCSGMEDFVEAKGFVDKWWAELGKKILKFSMPF